MQSCGPGHERYERVQMSEPSEERRNSRFERQLTAFVFTVGGYATLAAVPAMEMIGLNDPTCISFACFGGAVLAWSQVERDALDRDFKTELESKSRLLEHGTL